MKRKKDFLKAIEEHVGTKVQIIEKDTKFKFICDGCRDGSSQCCCNRDQRIIINPYDIYKLQKGLGKTSKEIFDKYIEISCGYESGLPIMLLGIKKLYTGEEVCPFIRRKTDENGMSRRYCSVHNFKPGVCSIFPLGRVTPKDEEKMVYILQEVNCGLKPKEDDPEITISDWVPDLENADKAFNTYYELLEEAVKILKFSELKKSTKISQASKDKVYNKFTHILCDFDTEKDFFEQIEENKAKVLEYTKEVVADLGKLDKKIIAK